MRILILNTYDLKGGAARATYRLHRGLRSIGVESTMLVKRKSGDDFSVITVSKDANRASRLVFAVSHPLDSVPLRRYPQREKTDFSVGWFPTSIAKQVKHLHPDVVHLTWVANGFVPISALAQFNCPIVWRMPDLWAATGGCHYAGECKGYLERCGKCPQLKSRHENDLSRQIWQQKNKYWHDINLTIVTPSRWLGECARSSRLFRERRVVVIPNGLDLTHYRPLNSKFAREAFGLPQDKKLVMFGAVKSLDDPRKGSHFLRAAMQQLTVYMRDNTELVIFGTTKPENPPDFGFKVHYAGILNDDISLALLYSAADVMVVPSTEEAFGQTASESLACGTPVVAFGATGLLDIVDHQQNGYLAQPFEVDDLAAGIQWVLADDERRARLAEQARRKAEAEFDILKIAGRYKALYEDILTANAPTPR